MWGEGKGFRGRESGARGRKSDASAAALRSARSLSDYPPAASSCCASEYSRRGLNPLLFRSFRVRLAGVGETPTSMALSTQQPAAA